MAPKDFLCSQLFKMAGSSPSLASVNRAFGRGGNLKSIGVSRKTEISVTKVWGLPSV